MWGKFWAERGYVGLYVDTFGPRGYAKGFEAGTNNGSRPSEINEITVPPSDAYMGLKYLRGRGDVEFIRYAGVTHSYDTPNPKRAAVNANVEATLDTKVRAEAFFRKFLAPSK